jgi:hypothetical protein
MMEFLALAMLLPNARNPYGYAQGYRWLGREGLLRVAGTMM